MIVEVEKQKTDRSDSQYQYLMMQSSQAEVTYQNICSLTMKVIILAFSSFYFGYCLTYLSTFSASTPETANKTILEFIYGSLAAKSSINGLLIGILPVGAIVGAGTAPLLMKILTRKQLVLLIGILALIVSFILLWGNIYALLVCRAFQGLFIGYYMAITPIYINELVPKQIVGSFGVFTQLFVVLGIVSSYGLGLFLSEAVNASPVVFFRIMVSINSILIVIQIILLAVGYIPESPYSLIKKNRNQEAMLVISQFTLPAYVQKAFKQKQMEVQVELNDNNQQQIDSKTKIVYGCRAFLLGFQLPFMQQMTGINSIITQASNIVEPILPGLSNYVPIIINSVQLVATLGSVFLLAKFGRKPLTLICNGTIGLIDIAIAVLLFFTAWAPSGYVVLILLIIYMIIFGISLGPVVWLYVPQIIPAKIVPYATMLNWLGCSICVIFTPSAVQANGGNAYPIFFFFGGLTLFFFVMNLFLMEETKGKSTKQIANLFNKKE